MSTTVPLAAASDPPVVHQFKWLMDRLALIFFVYPLKRVENTFPQTRGIIHATPNIMSVVRGVTAPYLVVQFYRTVSLPDQSQAWWWASLLTIIVLLDGIDGPLARRLDAVTDLGKLLDPLADKITMISMGVGLIYMVQRQGTPYLLVAVFLAVVLIELLLVGVALQFATLKLAQPNIKVDGANDWGKIKFGMQMSALIIAYLGQLLFPTSSDWVTSTITLLVASCYFSIRSLITHVADYRQVTVSLNPVQPPEVSP